MFVYVCAQKMKIKSGVLLHKMMQMINDSCHMNGEFFFLLEKYS